MSSLQISIIKKLCQSRSVLLEILKDRGYETSNYNNFSNEEIKTMYLNKQLDFEIKKPEVDVTIYIKFLIFSKLRNSSLKKYIDEFLEDFEDDVDLSKIEIIIIVKDKINDSLEKIVDDFYFQKNLYINLFFLDSIIKNLSKHSLVPKHTKISDEEFNLLKTQFNLKSRYQLPLISRKDIIAKYIGLKPGDVCKITRPSVTSGEYNSWRCCK